MAYSKTKLLESAQKFLSQGKLAQAIGEYQQILRSEPKDQNALMTVGDLYVRLNDVSHAVDYFQKLADLFLQEGFASKAIAIYKKIVKLVPGDTESLERLADLYVQQGVLSEARPIFLQLAELHLKENRSPKAVEVLRQLLEVEPENMRVRTRLAELYQALGQRKEAASVFLSSAYRMLDRGEFAEAQKIADRALQIDPGNARAAIVKGRALAAGGKAPEAIALLEALPDAESGAETTDFLIELYLQTGNTAAATEMARKAFARDTKRHPLVYNVALGLVDGGDAEAALELLGLIRSAMLEAGDPEKLSQALTTVAERLPGRLEPFEWQVDIFRHTNDSFRLPEALEQLAQAAVGAGQLEKGSKIYEELLERDPENEHLRRSLNQVRSRLGLAPSEPSAAASEEMVDETGEPAATIPEPPLDEETQRYLNQALTDVDLFSSYGLTQKAITLLETVLPRAPRHVVILERLLDLYLGVGDDRRTAELASQLEQIHRQRGDRTNADRFSELRRRFQRAAGITDEDLPAVPLPAPAAEFTIPTVEAEPAPEVEAVPVPALPPTAAAPVAAESAVHEVDLSAEWATLGEEVHEVGAISPSAEAPAPPAAPPPAEVQEPAPAEEFALELAPAVLPAEMPGGGGMSSDQFLRELAAEVEDMEAVQAPPVAAAAAPVPAPAAAVPPAGATPPSVPVPSEESVEQLREVFEEFRSELGEMGEEDEDLETHYNLGIAYREMGLLEEAIGEFQRVAKAIRASRPFRYTMQCYTLLGLSFMDKGEPKIAAMWYQRALETPGLDQESVLALRYDLGVALELADDKNAALESFRQVYAMNIDYRDVAERIATLGRQH
jgi:tetratricopeptide (TPR) repeat protein